jgi:hypothetical protein
LGSFFIASREIDMEASESSKSRRDTKLEAAGAEFLVLGHLLINKIPAYKAYTNFPGYDIVAVNPLADKVCRIQVKSRESTGSKGFYIKNYDCDFAVLNRGRLVKGVWKEEHKKDPDLYVLPVDFVQQRKSIVSIEKAVFKNEELEEYLNNWALIKQWLDCDS